MVNCTRAGCLRGLVVSSSREDFTGCGQLENLPMRLLVSKPPPRQGGGSFSEPLDRESTEKTGNWQIEAWDLKRTRNYGSRHYNQRRWQVTGVALSDDGRVVTLEVPDLMPTWGMSIRCKTRGEGGAEVVREIHNSVHNIGK